MAWIKRTFKRDWIRRSPWLNSISYRHELSNRTVWAVNPEKEGLDKKDLKPEDYYPHEQIFIRFELTFNISSEIITIHANREEESGVGLKAYIVKIELIRDLLSRFLSEYKPHYNSGNPFTVRDFLNPNAGTSSVYTSSMAIGTSTSHGFFFDISSCADKGRMYVSDEKEFIELLTKLMKFINSGITDANAALESYKARL